MKKSIALLMIGGVLFSCGNPSKNKNSQEENKTTEKEVSKKKASTNKSIDAEMVLFEEGTYLVGSEKGLPREKPVHEVRLKSFYIDKTPVTVGQFKTFVEATQHKTDAEKFGDSGVFNFETKQWQLLPGTYWRFPLGPDGPEAEDNYPVTHVSWNDAFAFANWAGKRLPTEEEWETAARCGKRDNKRFSWGNELEVNGKRMANVWEGDALDAEQKIDGYKFTSPVGAFGETACGLTDMGGNVWNWCADAYRPYKGNNEQYRFDENVKCIRGGSFFYDQYGADSYSVSGRSFNSAETSLFNTGFRCAKDAQ